MKKIYIVVCMLLCTSLLQAQDQDQDSLSIFTIYDDFQTTVLEKDVEGHTDLFISGESPVYIVKKETTGPIFHSLLNVNYWADFFSQSFVYELEISDIELTVDESFAITEAHFDEYINDELSAYGKDLFGYLKTEEGWKLVFLHNTVVLADDLTDYSVPFELPNSIESVIEDFTEYYNDQEGDLLLDLFIDDENQIISFNDLLPADYDPSEHYAIDFAIDLAASVDDQVLSVNNLDIHIVDDYVASVFCDYTVFLEDELIETGRAYFNLAASLEDGWMLSSFIRNSAALVNSVKEEEKSSFSIYPNPGQNSVNIKCDKGIEDIELIDSMGRIISKIQVNNVSQYLLDVSNYNSGHYLVRLRLSDGNKMLQRLVID